MSIYYYMGCKTCKTMIDMASFARESVVECAGEFAIRHAFHDLVLVHDLGDDDADDLYHEVKNFNGEEVAE